MYVHFYESMVLKQLSVLYFEAVLVFMWWIPFAIHILLIWIKQGSYLILKDERVFHSQRDLNLSAFLGAHFQLLVHR